jgi:hypothetical protein
VGSSIESREQTKTGESLGWAGIGMVMANVLTGGTVLDFGLW